MREWGAMETRAGIYGVFQRLPGFLSTLPCRPWPCPVAVLPTSRPPVPHLARETRALPVRLVPTGPIRIFNLLPKRPQTRYLRAGARDHGVILEDSALP